MSRTYSKEESDEIRRRIRLSVYAYAYEMMSVSLITDQEFDDMAKTIQPEFPTGNEELDTFFRTVFSPHTGQWIHDHPGKGEIAALYEKYYAL